MHIELTDYQIKLCRLFAEESAKTQQKIEFGNKSTTPRALEEIAHDTYIGKVAEAAIVTLAWREFGYKIPVNYEIYPRGQYDDEDININGWSIDVKATTKGKWLLVERNKIEFRKKENNLPDIIMLCKPIGNRVEMIGYTSTSKLIKDENLLLEGECIPDTKCRLQADNYALAGSELRDITEALRYMISRRNVSAEAFKRIAEAVYYKLRG